jgi:hypothetical protein
MRWVRGSRQGKIGYKKNKMSTDRESGRGNKRGSRRLFVRLVNVHHTAVSCFKNIFLTRKYSGNHQFKKEKHKEENTPQAKAEATIDIKIAK